MEAPAPSTGDEYRQLAEALVYLCACAGALSVAVVFACCCCCCPRLWRGCLGACCCCRSLARARGAERSRDECRDEVAASVKQALTPQLRRKKELGTAYLLWFFGGFAGAHHFYLDRLVQGMLAAWSFNFFFVGWLTDLFQMPLYVRTFNARAADVALRDRSFRRLYACVPLAMGIWIGSLLGFICCCPRAIHNWGFLDIDKTIAGTRENPYDLLGIPRNASRSDAETAYRREWSRTQSVWDCDAKCRAKLTELKKAHDFFTGATTRTSSGRPTSTSKKTHDSHPAQDGLDDWLDFVFVEWQVIYDHIQKNIDTNEFVNVVLRFNQSRY